MKKFNLMIACVFIAAASLAQHGPKFGLKAGVNLANVNIQSGSTEVETDSRTSFHIGALAHIHLSPEWGIQPELVYSGQGFEQKFDNARYHYKTDYINLPIMIQYMFNNGFRIEAGPQIGFLISGKQEDQNDVESDIKNNYKSTDISAGFGLSYLSYSGFGVGARYNLGLTDINDFGTNEIKNRVFQVGIFYLFDSAHKAKSR